MREDRLRALESRVQLLVGAFPTLVSLFQEKPAFRRRGQLEYHRETIALRRAAGSAAEAIRSREFLTQLYKTLQAWGIGSRGSRLVPLEQFEATFRKREHQIAELEALTIDASGLDVPLTCERLWGVISGLRITDNKATLVPCTKALHHLLPDLVVPIDREYTQSFFGWHNPEFQTRQEACFKQAFEVFARIARTVNPEQYVGEGWNTSRTKVIDNAIVGLFVAAAELVG